MTKRRRRLNIGLMSLITVFAIGFIVITGGITIDFFRSKDYFELYEKILVGGVVIASLMTLSELTFAWMDLYHYSHRSHRGRIQRR